MPENAPRDAVAAEKQIVGAGEILKASCRDLCRIGRGTYDSFLRPRRVADAALTDGEARDVERATREKNEDAHIFGGQ